MTVTMKNVNVSSETLLSNSTVIEAELDALEQQLRRLQAQADEDARLIHQVWQAQQQVQLSLRIPRRLLLAESLLLARLHIV